MKKVIISGGAGFIGARLSKRLVKLGYKVVILDCFSEQVHGKKYSIEMLKKFIDDDCEIIVGDVRNKCDWELALKDANIIVHFAAETGTGQSMYQIYHYNDVNILGTARLLDVIEKDHLKIEKIIVASSRAVYGEGKYYCSEHGINYPNLRDKIDIENGLFNPICPICKQSMNPLATDECSRLAPTSVYGVTKQFQEQLIHLFGKTTGISTIALRYQNVYGPGQSLKNPYTGILSIFSTSLLHGNKIYLFEDGNETRDFVYIDDVVNATILAIESTKYLNDSINVGSGQATTVKKIAEILKRLYNSKSDIEITGKFRSGDIRHNYADLTKAKLILNYSPAINLEEGLSRFSQWVLTQEIECDKYMNSIRELEEKGLYR